MADIILKNGIGQPIEYKNIETMEVPKADTTIVSEMEFSGFAYEEYFGLYMVDVNPSPLMLEVGEKYEVIWDGAMFICECQDLSAMSDGALGVGNLADFGGTGNGEPFVVAIVDGIAMLASFTEGVKHTVTIAKIGGTQIFSEGVAVEMPTPIPLDFSAGNQTITAPDGYLVKSAILEKPETLVPENVAEGVNVAGVVGTMEASKPALEDVPITLDFSAGNQTINAPEGYLVKSAILQKPDTLVPANVAKNVNVAGIVGTHEGGGSINVYVGNYAYESGAYYFTATKSVGMIDINGSKLTSKMSNFYSSESMILATTKTLTLNVKTKISA